MESSSGSDGTWGSTKTFDELSCWALDGSDLCDILDKETSKYIFESESSSHTRSCDIRSLINEITDAGCFFERMNMICAAIISHPELTLVGLPMYRTVAG